MKGFQREKEILLAALRKLREEVPVGACDVKWQVPTGRGTVFDAVLTFEKNLHEYAVVLYTSINPEMLDALEFYLAAAGRTVLLVTGVITDITAAELKKRNIQFLDALGNMYIVQENPFVLVHKTGTRPQKHAGGMQANAFTGTRLRVVFALLANEDAVNRTYRDIAELAGVALGTVGGTFSAMKMQDFIREYKHKRKMMNRQKLVNRWLDAYPTDFRPTLNPRRFTTPDRNWWTRKDLAGYGAVLGGETAAAVLTKHLHPENGVIYTTGDIHELATALKLRADPRGNLTVMDRFWKEDAPQTTHIPVAPPLLVCAELLAVGGERNIETATMIRASHGL
jgi:hypothetical protein